MAHEVEAAALDSAEGVLGRKPPHTRPIGAPCPNCATPLAGAWCHVCGQSSEDFHRSLMKLAAEALGGLIDVDSRLWRTLPNLCLRPARLTRAYLDGHRISQIPPFRLFLVVVVLVFLVGGLQQGPTKTTVITPNGVTTVPPGSSLAFDNSAHSPFERWMIRHAEAVAKDPTKFEAALSEWAQRLAILSLPVSAVLLGAMFFWRREVYMFDHLIFSMHSLSFQGLLLSASMLATKLSDVFGLVLLLAPAHLFFHMRGTYALSVFGTLARMSVLLIGSLIALVFGSLALVMIGFLEMGQ